MGRMEGILGRLGVFQPRPGRDRRTLLLTAAAVVVVVAITAYTYSRAYASDHAFNATTGFDAAAFGASRVAFGIVMLVFTVLAAYGLFIRRDLGAVLALAAGLGIGIVARLPPTRRSAGALTALFPAGGSRAFGVEAALRLLSVALPPSLLFLTTPPDRLLADLERRGLPPAAAFVVAAALGAVPRMRDRAQCVGEALRARGPDPEGGAARRLRGLTPFGAAMVQGTLAEGEDRTLALEVRGFRSARRRTILRPPPDRALEQAIRLLLLLVAAVAIAIRAWPR